MNTVGSTARAGNDEISLGWLLCLLGAQRWVLAGVAIATSVLGFGGASLLPPVFTAKAVILPPQQQQSSAASALSSLGALAGLAGGGALTKSPADQYVAFMQSYVVIDKLIDRFKLQDVYESKFRDDARKQLLQNTVINVGKKDGLITIEVDDVLPQRAADIANAYVDGLRDLTNTLAISEAQQRRVFFERQLSESKTRLTQAQIDLQGSGIGPGALKGEPKAAAEVYARVRAEVTAAEIKLQGLRQMLADNSSEVRQQLSVLTGLRSELLRFAREQRPEANSPGDAGYVAKYREYKYQETLFELFTRQYEAARLDESREGALIQVVDAAAPPERKSKPKRSMIAGLSGLAGLSCAVLWVVFRSGRSSRSSLDVGHAGRGIE